VTIIIIFVHLFLAYNPTTAKDLKRISTEVSLSGLHEPWKN
jgi:hypothetical protein